MDFSKEIINNIILKPLIIKLNKDPTVKCKSPVLTKIKEIELTTQNDHLTPLMSSKSLKTNLSFKSVSSLNINMPQSDDFFNNKLNNAEKTIENQLTRKNKNTIIDNMINIKKRHKTVIPQTNHDNKLLKNQQKKENICLTQNAFNFKSMGYNNRIITLNNNENLTSNAYLNEYLIKKRSSTKDPVESLPILQSEN